VENIITLRARDVLLKATASSKLDLRVESEVGFVIDAPKAHYFDPVSGMNMVAGAASSQKKGRIR
jgi:hypothetical protein